MMMVIIQYGWIREESVTCEIQRHEISFLNKGLAAYVDEQKTVIVRTKILNLKGQIFENEIYMDKANVYLEQHVTTVLEILSRCALELLAS